MEMETVAMASAANIVHRIQVSIIDRDIEWTI